MKNDIKLKGSYEIKLFGPDGKLKEHIMQDNMTTDAGMDALMQRGFSTQTGSSALNYIGVGSDDTAAASGNTALGYALAVDQGAYAHTDGGHNFSLTKTFAAGVGTGSVYEYVIQNGSPTGQVFSRSVESLIVKNAADTLEVVFAGSWT